MQFDVLEAGLAEPGELVLDRVGAIFARVVEAFGDKVYDTVISRTVRFPETTVAGEPITTWASSSVSA